MSLASLAEFEALRMGESKTSPRERKLCVWELMDVVRS